MRASANAFLISLALAMAPGLAHQAAAEEPIRLAEDFRPGHGTRVEMVVRLDGKLSVPGEKGQGTELVTVFGKSQIVYDERMLPPDVGATFKTVRGYRDVQFVRVLGNNQQEAGIRPSVRRMVVMKSENRRAPFSPDGPLTWGEIDVVRTDIFNPVVVSGLLPRGEVRKSQSWKASAAAVAELTDMEKVESGELTVEFEGLTTIAGRRSARLNISGSIRGINEDGPNLQKLEGHAFFDLEDQLLSYLSLRGTHELLDGKGQTVGRIEGQFTMSRSLLAKMPPDLSDASLEGLDLKPAAENCLLLYVNQQMGVRFLYPRGWRIGVVQGRQVTIDHARGTGVIITVEPTSRVPSAESYQGEVSDFLKTQKKAKLSGIEKPTRVRAEPVTLDRFGFSAELPENRLRMEYAVLKQSDGGATVAVTIPSADAALLKDEIERIIRSLSITRKIEEK